MIKKYTKKDGSTAYMFVAYLGTDPVTGKQKRTTRRGFKTKRDATIAEAKLLSDVDNNKLVNQDNMTFQQAYDGWYEQYKLSVKESTLNVVNSLVRKTILPEFGKIKVKDISIKQCQSAVNKWWEHYANFRHYKTYATQILDYAVIAGAIDSNPFKKIRVPRSKEKVVNETDLYYTKEELKTFLSFIQDDVMYYAIFRTLAFTGLRKGELQALQWKDIDFDQLSLTVNKTVTYGEKSRQIINSTKTRASNRTISIDKGTALALKKWQIEQRKVLLMNGYAVKSNEQFIFTNTETNQLLSKMTITHKLWYICDSNNFKRIKLHGFRHTCCSLLFESGATLQEVQARLGHSDIKTTMNIYAHVTEYQQEKTANKLAAYINF
ncbi:site-specific integrase [Eremococcus coleocola]|uniref:site-specific integrase n=1 Tax=Eremococcus coleocola TaxID=88132 RepID=UPI0004114CBB|nr:site-specific integrase [Eremococcus coleocola]